MSNWYIDTFGGVLADIDHAIRSFASEHNHTAPIFWRQMHEHFDWSYPNALEITPDSGSAGKRIRPLLMALVARSLRGSYDHVLPAGVGLEIIHNFTLVHDDIMDGDSTRRGRPTLWTQYGVAQAINTGDGMYSLGILSSLSLTKGDVPADKALSATQILMQACFDTVQGQALDLSFEDRTEVTADEYLTMIGGKTGALIEAATRIGALLSTDDEAVIRHYATFGRYLGLAFQMWDDYLGIWGDPEKLGKSATGDIENRKKSYPITYAFTHADEPQRHRLVYVYEKEELDEADVLEVMGVLDELDVKGKTEAIVEEYYNTAMTALDSVAVDNDDHNKLKQIAQFIIHRNY